MGRKTCCCSGDYWQAFNCVDDVAANVYITTEEHDCLVTSAGTSNPSVVLQWIESHIDPTGYQVGCYYFRSDFVGPLPAYGNRPLNIVCNLEAVDGCAESGCTCSTGNCYDVLDGCSVSNTAVMTVEMDVWYQTATRTISAGEQFLIAHYSFSGTGTHMLEDTGNGPLCPTGCFDFGNQRVHLEQWDYLDGVLVPTSPLTGTWDLTIRGNTPGPTENNFYCLEQRCEGFASLPPLAFTYMSYVGSGTESVWGMLMYRFICGEGTKAGGTCGGITDGTSDFNWSGDCNGLSVHLDEGSVPSPDCFNAATSDYESFTVDIDITVSGFEEC